MYFFLWMLSRFWVEITVQMFHPSSYRSEIGNFPSVKKTTSKLSEKITIEYKKGFHNILFLIFNHKSKIFGARHLKCSPNNNMYFIQTWRNFRKHFFICRLYLNHRKNACFGNFHLIQFWIFDTKTWKINTSVILFTCSTNIAAKISKTFVRIFFFKVRILTKIINCS